MRFTGLTLAGALFANCAFAQPTQVAHNDEPKFDVVSVKKSTTGKGGILYHLPGGRFKATGYTLLNLIAFSYEIPESRILGLTPWASSEQFDVEATAEGPAEADPKQMETPTKRAMVRHLLAERFRLEVRREVRDSPKYALTVSSKGPKFERNREKPYLIQAGKRSFKFQKVSMDDFSNFLTNSPMLNRDIGRTVINKTGLTGQFDFDLTWMPATVMSRDTPSPDPRDPLPNSLSIDPPPLFAALEQELGLRLHPDRGPEPFLVIIRATPPSDN